jgi:hypothetical protein
LTGPDYVRCQYCRKSIRVGRFLGTLHLCLSPEERAEIDRQHRLAAWQMREQKRIIREGMPPLSLTNIGVNK